MWTTVHAMADTDSLLETTAQLYKDGWVHNKHPQFLIFAELAVTQLFRCGPGCLLPPHPVSDLRKDTLLLRQ